MIVNRLTKYRNKQIIGKFVTKILEIYGVSLPREVKIGKNVVFRHNSPGTVIHRRTIIEDNVNIFQNVTLGRADVQIREEESKFEGLLVREGAILCTGAKVLCKEGILVVGKNSIVAANAVLTRSIPDNEIWGGIPAKKIGEINK